MDNQSLKKKIIEKKKEIDYAYSGHSQLRCDACGKFLSIDQVSKSELTPDSEYTRESTEFICERFDNNDSRN
jgi:hypothetical protein